MAKLGYTWYPKDWGNSEKVFELTLIERGLYRELIDMAMQCDNKTQTNSKTWARKFGSTETEIEWILGTLEELKLIEFKGDTLFIPSCESRLKLVRAGSKGGKNSKPNSKHTLKPFESLNEKNQKHISNQREKETKIEIEIKDKTEVVSKVFLKDSEIELLKMKFKENYNEALEILSNYKNAKGVSYDSDYHAIMGWVKSRIEETAIKNKIDKPKGGKVLE
jgi:hypothetical protein